MADVVVQTNPPSTFFTTLMTMTFGAIVGGTAVYLLHRVQEMEPSPVPRERVRVQTTRRAFAPRHDGGWYVKLFNYEAGHPDRRLKGLEGPFRSEGEADHVAAHQGAVWFTKVQYFRTAPRL